MADKKKPVDGAEDQTDRKEQSSAEAAEGRPEDGLTDASGTDTLAQAPDTLGAAGAEDSLPAEDTAEITADETLTAGDETLPAAEDSLTPAEDLTAPDPLMAGDESLPREDSLTKGDDSVLAGDDSLTTGDDSVLAGDDSLSHDDSLPATERDEPIHTLGEAMEGEAAQAAAMTEADTIAGDRAEPAATAPAAAAAPQVVRETVVERKGGFVPMVLGGVIAAGLGWGVASWQAGTLPFAAGAPDPFRDEVTTGLSGQAERLTALEGRVEDLSSQLAGIDMAALQTQAEDLSSRLGALEGAQSDQRTQLGDLAGRIDTLESRPVEESVSPEAMAAYEEALADVRRAIEAQRTEVERMTQESLAAQADASDQAQLAQSRAALADVSTALRDGTPYDEPMSVLTTNGVTVPEVLASSAAEGVPTLAALTEEFPPLARDALSAARRAEATTEDTTARVTTFLANQLGARSVTPRDGADPDAVLSRAEAALRSGDLAATLQELEALPAPAAEVLTGWTARAETRQGALDAADAVAQDLNQE